MEVTFSVPKRDSNTDTRVRPGSLRPCVHKYIFKKKHLCSRLLTTVKAYRCHRNQHMRTKRETETSKLWTWTTGHRQLKQGGERNGSWNLFLVKLATLPIQGNS